MRWGITAMVSEPDPLVLAWVAHYLAIGADHVWIYLDGDHASLRAQLANVAACTVIRVDAAHWPFDTPRPSPVAARQRLALQHRYDLAQVEWLLHADVDEFLNMPDITTWLAGLGDDIDYAFALVSERLHVTAPDPDNIFDGVFRIMTPAPLADQVAAIDGPGARFLDRGMAGYAGGKSFFRTGRGLEAKLHVPRYPRRFTRATLPGHPLLHFDGLTVATWLMKKQRLIAQQPNAVNSQHLSRRSQFRAISHIHDGPHVNDTDPATLYHRIKCATPDRLAALDALGLIQRPQLDIPQALERYFPNLSVDLSTQAYDRFPITWAPYRAPPLPQRLRVFLARVARRLGLERNAG